MNQKHAAPSWKRFSSARRPETLPLPPVGGALKRDDRPKKIKISDLPTTFFFQPPPPKKKKSVEGHEIIAGPVEIPLLEQSAHLTEWIPQPRDNYRCVNANGNATTTAADVIDWLVKTMSAFELIVKQWEILITRRSHSLSTCKQKTNGTGRRYRILHLSQCLSLNVNDQPIETIYKEIRLTANRKMKMDSRHIRLLLFPEAWRWVRPSIWCALVEFHEKIKFNDFAYANCGVFEWSIV